VSKTAYFHVQATGNQWGAPVTRCTETMNIHSSKIVKHIGRDLPGILFSRRKFWPRPRPRLRSFGLSFKHLASAWPRSRCFIM